MSPHDLEKAASYGEPSYVWRAGQERRLSMILSATGEQLKGLVFDNGCGVGMYLQHLAPYCGWIAGLEYDLERARAAGAISPVINGACEHLPLRSGSVNAILSHEVLEHVQDDRRAVEEMVRLLKPGGLIALFLPNLGYPYETHGVYWRGRYHFGNIPLVHYLPVRWRKQLIPHVRAYTTADIYKLFCGLPVKILTQTIIFGAYDNIIYRYPPFGHFLRSVLQRLERTPLKIFGLSHFWVVEKE
jgi:SAM-dependent methyltransferase